MKLLWLKTELLHPVNRGGRIRTYHMLRALRRDHHITYLTLDDGNADPNAEALAHEYCQELIRIPFRTTAKDSWRLYGDLFLNLFSPLPYAVAKYASPEMRRQVVEQVGAGRYDCLVCDFLFPSQNVPSGLSIPTILFQHNVEAAIWERHTHMASSPLRRWYFGRQWRRMAAFERRECRRFDHVVAVSEQDAARLAEDYELSGVSAVPTGVDLDYFRPTTAPRVGPPRLVFTGSMDWMPNEDAIVYFATKILPRIRDAAPDVTLSVVGRYPSANLVQLAASTPGLRIEGEVPDVRPFMEQAAVFVVPIRIGGGTRLKIFEALAMELPVVTTTVGAEGLPLEPDTHVLLADDPAAFADRVLGLLRDPDRARALARRGAAFVREHFGWDRAANTFAEICARVIAPARPI